MIFEQKLSDTLTFFDVTNSNHKPWVFEIHTLSINDNIECFHQTKPFLLLIESQP